MDVSHTFLHGDFFESVHIQFPKGYTCPSAVPKGYTCPGCTICPHYCPVSQDKRSSGKVYRLLRSLSRLN